MNHDQRSKNEQDLCEYSGFSKGDQGTDDKRHKNPDVGDDVEYTGN